MKSYEDLRWCKKGVGWSSDWRTYVTRLTYAWRATPAREGLAKQAGRTTIIYYYLLFVAGRWSGPSWVVYARAVIGRSNARNGECHLWSVISASVRKEHEPLMEKEYTFENYKIILVGFFVSEIDESENSINSYREIRKNVKENRK